MYTGYFGLKEAPFSIAPNPQFLFYSDRHKEALAHLSFGLDDKGGFVLLTGEVGTGKTTVSRAVMSQLPDTTQSAFILNPTLSEHELLATICDELKIRYRKTGATLKTLTDKIRDRLLKNHQQGINTLLIIDEAQHLRPEVLEQLRLLTNLETDTQKLLKVILIGQPELQALLKRQELRQLAQRITARYHLLPLSLNDVSAYLSHRLNIAGCERLLFDKGAVKALHDLSGGIPRLINLMADRALLGAFGQHKPMVDKKIVYQAAQETLGTDHLVTQSKPRWPWAAGAAAAVFGISLLASFLWQTEQEQAVPVVQEAMETQQVQTQRLPDAMPSGAGANDAIVSLISLWNSQAQNCDELSQLHCFRYQGSLRRLLAMGRPAVIKLVAPEGGDYFALLKGYQGSLITLHLAGEELKLELGDVAAAFSGSAVLVWQSPLEELQHIGPQSNLEDIQWLETSISFALDQVPRVIESYDPILDTKVRQFQRNMNMPTTGRADTPTMIRLALEQSAIGPRLDGKEG